jgi:hypothetical protein
MDDGCSACGETLLEITQTFPGCFTVTLAADRVAWSRPRVMMYCKDCAAEIRDNTPVLTGAYFETTE